MRTTIIALENGVCEELPNGEFKSTFRIPTLEAYAISNLIVHLGALSSPWPLDCLSQDNLILSTPYELNNMECSVTLYYIGIRDYSLLFPTVSPDTLQCRLGQFYSELEVTFESCSWLTFMLMAGAIVEGLLYSKSSTKDVLEKLIDDACTTGFLSTTEKTLLHKVRAYRNLVHANKHSTDYVLRKDAMDSRLLVDRLLHKASY